MVLSFKDNFGDIRKRSAQTYGRDYVSSNRYRLRKLRKASIAAEGGQDIFSALQGCVLRAPAQRSRYFPQDNWLARLGCDAEYLAHTMQAERNVSRHCRMVKEWFLDFSSEERLHCPIGPFPGKSYSLAPLASKAQQRLAS